MKHYKYNYFSRPLYEYTKKYFVLHLFYFFCLLNNKTHFFKKVPGISRVLVYICNKKTQL